MNIGPKRPIPWKNSRRVQSWRFYLHCGIEATGSRVIICIVCHQVLRHPSEHGTSSMGKHLLAKAHMAKFNELRVWEGTELTSSTVNDTALTVLKVKGSRGITTVTVAKKIIFDIQFNSYWPKWQTKYSKLADKDFQTSRIWARQVESLPHVTICFWTYSVDSYIKTRGMTVTNGIMRRPSATVHYNP